MGGLHAGLVGFESTGGGSSSIDTGNTLWIDAVNGNDGTAITGRLDQPWLTVSAALAAATSGDVVHVGPGTYSESGLTLPAGVVLNGDSWQTTAIGSAAAVADILTMGTGCGINGITVVVPTGAFAGIKHAAGTGSVTGINIQGDGVTGSGDGIYKTGTGKLIGGLIRNEAGGLSSYLRVDSGVLALDDVHCPQSAGTTDVVALVTGTGVFQSQGFNVGCTNVVDAIQVGGTGTVRIYSPNISNVANAVHVTADGPSITITGGKISATLRTVWVDPALTGTGTTVRCLGTALDPLFDFPSAAAGNTDFLLQFNQVESDTRDSRQRLIGGDLALGFPELGSGFEVGRGSPYSDGIHVVTTDGTETMVGSVVTGGTQTDVTTAAASRDSSTFTFQGLTTNHAIYIASKRKTPAGVELKHWGYVLNQVAAMVGGSTVIEIWDGAAWAAIGVMAASVEEQYLYADQTFLRASSHENIHLGIDASTTQALSTVNGHSAYHTRIRVTALLTTAPTWERLRLQESSVAFNKLGQMSALGLSRWRSQLFGVGNIWGEIAGGGAKDADIPVGSGGVPTGWTAKIKKAKLDDVADSVSFQFQIPDGICTAFPLEFKVVYSLIGTNPVTVAPNIILSVLVLGVGGVLISDSSGALVPVARAVADAEEFTSKPATAITVATDTGTVENRPLSIEFGPYPIDDYYTGDSVIIYLEMDSEGVPAQDFVIWTLVVSGVRFTQGQRL